MLWAILSTGAAPATRGAQHPSYGPDPIYQSLSSIPYSKTVHVGLLELWLLTRNPMLEVQSTGERGRMAS